MAFGNMLEADYVMARKVEGAGSRGSSMSAMRSDSALR